MGDPPEARTALVAPRAPSRAPWLAKAAANGTQIFADVGWDPTQQWSRDLLDQLALCHAFLPNETEAMAYTRTDTAVAALGTLAELVPVAVVTRGGDGAIAVDQTTGEYAQVPALDVESWTRRAPVTCSARASSRPPSAAGRWRSGCGSPYSPPGCRCSSHGGALGRPRLVRRRPLVALARPTPT